MFGEFDTFSPGFFSSFCYSICMPGKISGGRRYFPGKKPCYSKSVLCFSFGTRFPPHTHPATTLLSSFSFMRGNFTTIAQPKTASEVVVVTASFFRLEPGFLLLLLGLNLNAVAGVENKRKTITALTVVERLRAARRSTFRRSISRKLAAVRSPFPPFAQVRRPEEDRGGGKSISRFSPNHFPAAAVGVVLAVMGDYKLDPLEARMSPLDRHQSSPEHQRSLQTVAQNTEDSLLQAR